MTQDKRIPARDDCVSRYLLDKWATRTPDKLFAVFEDGQGWSYAEFRERVRERARALRALGVVQGEHVLVWLPNGPECLVDWFAISYLGAVYVPINTAYRGALLEHAVKLSAARLALVHADLAPRLASIGLAAVETIVIVSGHRQDQAAVNLPGVRLLGREVLANPPDDPLELARPIQPWDTHCVIYTSGTTGPSKGVLSSYVQIHETGLGFPLATADDRHMVTLPLFHVGGTIPIYLMLARNGSFSLVESFDTNSFWATVKRTGTTTVILLGVMAGFLVRRPESDESRDSPLRWVSSIPYDADSLEFGRRFGVDLITFFNMTEVSCPLVSELNPTQTGFAGRPRPGVQVRLVDTNDCEVPPGQVGELILRTDTPWAMNSGYFDNPQATAIAWRNGWFHTGDAFRCDEDGRYFFVDRMKDAIRRRGENISSFEVESEVLAFPGVREAAAVAVPSEVSEDEVLVAVAMKEGQTLDPVALTTFLRERMAHFMVPRYLRVLDNLPKTPTQKVEKHLIRKEGVTPDTWDRVAAGIQVRRDKLAAD